VEEGLVQMRKQLFAAGFVEGKPIDAGVFVFEHPRVDQVIIIDTACKKDDLCDECRSMFAHESH